MSQIPSSNTYSDVSSSMPSPQGGSSEKVSRFWSIYEKALNKHGVKDLARRWYVVRVEHYIKAAKGRKLSSHTAEEVTAYLDEQGSKPKVQDWQLAQSAHAIQILFCDVIKISWCGDIDWMRWREGGGVLSADHPTIARDSRAIPGGDDARVVLDIGPRAEVLNQVMRAIRPWSSFRPPCHHPSAVLND